MTGHRVAVEPATRNGSRVDKLLNLGPSKERTSEVAGRDETPTTAADVAAMRVVAFLHTLKDQLDLTGDNEGEEVDHAA